MLFLGPEWFFRVAETVRAESIRVEQNMSHQTGITGIFRFLIVTFGRCALITSRCIIFASPCSLWVCAGVRERWERLRGVLRGCGRAEGVSVPPARLVHTPPTPLRMYFKCIFLDSNMIVEESRAGVVSKVLFCCFLCALAGTFSDLHPPAVSRQRQARTQARARARVDAQLFPTRCTLPH